ncbi:hypothetical protein HUG17_5723 [Dermatophagoides farinae]|uniref:MRH domain-containing protein n=1 Tax=Dermatophagoides farinae TaxID=6954 RepID=A0A9D4P202_DERFA|nr:hypothetical protein HUG17_5723 [Dermatophagoides farinae]
MISINRLMQIIEHYNSIIIQIYLSFIPLFIVITYAFSHLSQQQSDSVCSKTTDYKYDFTECDEFGGKWRVLVPNTPDHCANRSITYVPTRIHNCYTSCEGGQFFNKSSLFCEDCQPGHYSLSGGIVFDNFKSLPNSLPDGFHVKTEYRGHDNIADGLCSGWYVDNTTGTLILRIDMKQANANSGCISIVTYTAKVVKRGRLRFTYHYKTPNNMPLSLLFTFNYRLYDGIGVIENDIDTNIKFPMTTMERKFETIELPLQTPGLYIFTWKSVVIKNFRNYFSVSNMMNFDSYGHSPINFDGFQNQGNSYQENLLQNMLSTIGIIRIEKIIIEGVAYASECTPCEAGTYAPEAGMKECLLCPQNTAFNGSGSIRCSKCDLIKEYAVVGSTYCSKRPVCGSNDFFAVPKNACDPHSLKQEIEYRWIEPRICVDSNSVFPRGNSIINCTLSNHTIDCDLGMEIKSESNGKFCQFCPEGYYRDEKIVKCQPCSPMTNPYYALSVRHWNNSLPGWSHHPVHNMFNVHEDFFAENSVYLNSYFSRQCFRSDDDLVYNAKSSNDATIFDAKGECISTIAWQTFDDYIRTGASAPLNAYLILSLAIPYFRSAEQNELTFDFELNCNQNNNNDDDDDDDQCLFLFVETLSDESDLQSNEKDFIQQQSTTSDININSGSNNNKKKYFSFSQQTINQVIKEWTQSTDARTVFRHKIRRNISLTFSWIFKRTTSFQSYAKIHSLLLTGSAIGSAIRCQSCPTIIDSSLSSSSLTECISCPNGQYLHRMVMNTTGRNDSGQELLMNNNNYRCENCPENYILNNNNNNNRDGLPVGIESCVACGENLHSDNDANICYSNCLVTFDHQDHYDLNELEQPIIYKGINLFTSGGTQYMNMFQISLCGHRKRDHLSTCLNNITVFADDSSGVRSFICRSTIIPDGSKIFTAQSASLGDELLLITRQTSYANISIHDEFLNSPDANKYDKDFHLFFKTNSPTTVCLTGRKLTITMRCMPGKEMAIIKTPNSCPDGTCNGCDFHLLIETGTAAACRLCRPYSNDYETVIGECIDGSQQIHYVNPKGCVMKKSQTNDTTATKYVIRRPCSLLLPKQVQIGIAIAMQQVELQQLFPNESNKNNRQTFDDEGYETIHLISANTSQTPTTTTTTTNNLTI